MEEGMELPVADSPYTLELTNMFSLDLVVQGYMLKERNGRNSYVKGKTIKWNVNSEDFTLDGLSAELRVGRDQSITVWYFNVLMAQDVRLTQSDEFHVMFDMYKAERNLTLAIVVLDNPYSETLAPMLDKADHVSEPTIPDNDVLVVGFHGCPLTPSKNVASHSTSSLKQSAQVVPSAPVIETDPFDVVEEYVGVDDEYMYDVHLNVSATSVEQSDNVQEAEEYADVFAHHEEEEVADTNPTGYNVVHDPENPDIRVGALFPDIVAFRKAIRQRAIIVGFKLAKIKTDPTRFIARCAHATCKWRIHASVLQDGRTVMIKTLPFEHNCPTQKLSNCTMASQGWIADRIGDWVKKNPGVGAKAAKGKLEDEYNIKLEYNKTWHGMKVALDQIHGSYEDSFPLLFNWKAEIEHKSPRSIVEIELVKNGTKHHFNRMFVAFKSCIDGFLAGCRPYVGIDSTALNGKYKGQLASATAVDGHNWLYYVAFAVFDSETNDNWEWFMKQLHRSIGSPHGLVISSDACKGLETAIDLVFPDCENRECARHMYANFMKKFHGKVYSDNLYPAARTFSERKFMHHMNIIKEANSEAIEYLDIYHHRLWYRCGFGEASKVDYLTNNISESFNKQIKDFKGLNICNLMDRLRELIVEKFCLRRQVGEKLKGRILPHVIKQLNALSKTIGRNKIIWTTEHEAEVTLLDLKFVKRHIVNLQSRTCTCRVWQVSGKPCMHAIAFICSINGAQIETYVDDYYSVEKFKAAYAGRIPSMTDKSQWINVDLGLKVHPPLQQSVAGRPRVQRIRGWLEPGRKIVKCKKCGALGHFEKTCKNPDPKYVAVNNDDNIPEDPKYAPDASTPTNKRKKGEETAATTDGDAADDEILINLIRKKSRTTPQKPNTPTKEKTPVKITTTQEKTKTHVKKVTSQEKSKKKTPVKKTAASQEKAKTPVKKAMSQKKAKKKTPPKKTTSKGKKSKKNVPFAPVRPPPSPPVVQPPYGAKRSLFHWLGG